MSAYELPTPPRSTSRLDSVDLLRGLVMVLMALDHVRFYFAVRGNPDNLATASTELFVTRWITHFCAPVFVFLAGTGAYLRLRRGGSRVSLAWFLFSRGLWLIVVEFTLLHWAWTFSFDYRFFVGQVIFAIGASMVALSAMVFLPPWVVGLVGLTIICGHNLFDDVRGENLGQLGWLWDVLHTPRAFQLDEQHVFFLAYPLLPWFGVMAAGYGFGMLLEGEPGRRRARLLFLGLFLTATFVALRALNGYGDSKPWSPQTDELRTVLSFVNCQKYPPSLLFLLMTLGPAIMVLALADFAPAFLARPLVVFGRVPLFYYLLHFALIHAVAIVFAEVNYGRFDWLCGPITLPAPEGYGYSLPILYAVWAGCVIALYPLCLWYAAVKQHYPRGILSYF